MRTINIQTATAELSRLVDAAAHGEEIIIARSGKPLARLMPLARDTDDQLHAAPRAEAIIEVFERG
jgi:prevent-host-death family protein